MIWRALIYLDALPPSSYAADICRKQLRRQSWVFFPSHFISSQLIFSHSSVHRDVTRVARAPLCAAARKAWRARPCAPPLGRRVRRRRRSRCPVTPVGSHPAGRVTVWCAPGERVRQHSSASSETPTVGGGSTKRSVACRLRAICPRCFAIVWMVRDGARWCATVRDGVRMGVRWSAIGSAI
jgi:hypothetical protein